MIRDVDDADDDDDECVECRLECFRVALLLRLMLLDWIVDMMILLCFLLSERMFMYDPQLRRDSPIIIPPGHQPLSTNTRDRDSLVVWCCGRVVPILLSIDYCSPSVSALHSFNNNLQPSNLHALFLSSCERVWLLFHNSSHLTKRTLELSSEIWDRCKQAASSQTAKQTIKRT